MKLTLVTAAVALGTVGNVFGETCAKMDSNCSDKCNEVPPGCRMYVVNERNDKRVRATVRVDWNTGVNHGQNQQVVEVPAGGKVQVGCSKSSIGTTTTEYRFTLVGCEVL